MPAIARIGIANGQILGKFRISTKVTCVSRAFGSLPGPFAIGVASLTSDTGAVEEEQKGQ